MSNDYASSINSEMKLLPATPARCETLLYISTAAVPRLDLDENPRTSLGPGFFRSLLEPSAKALIAENPQPDAMVD
jgi:hypothetical protein